MAESSGAAPRAVVFDLDDTLFDAYGQCVVPAHAEAAAAMRAAGLQADVAAVRALREALSGAPDLDERVARAFPCRDPERAAQAGREAFYRRDPGAIAPFHFTLAVVEAARASGAALLLSAGDARTQGLKLERLGLAAAFDEVRIVDPAAADAKRHALGGWLEGLGLAAERVLVVGDRPGSEIAAALALGCRALRIRAGECARQPSPFGVPEAPDVRAVLRWL